ncbi:hypothetical protein pb186bvf_006914 [Paramecium bursaria]
MMDEKDPDYVFKYIIVGNAFSGKTSLIYQYIYERMYQHSYCIMEFPSRSIFVKQKKIKLQLWDTHGAERYRAITKAFYKGAVGALIVFDITNKDTFEALDTWISAVNESSCRLTQILVIGNKLDLNKNRVISVEDAQEFCKKHELPYLETSALTGEFVDEAFKQLTIKILECSDDCLYLSIIFQSKPMKLINSQKLQRMLIMINLIVNLAAELWNRNAQFNINLIILQKPIFRYSLQICVQNSNQIFIIC